jgi:hypothetical protein
MKMAKEYTMALVSLIVTLVLTLIAEYLLQLTPEGTYLTFAIGVMITLSTTLLEKELETKVREEISDRMELYHLITSIDDPELQCEVHQLAKTLSAGEIPPHIASIRSMQLWREVKYSVQASDYSERKETFYRWEGARLRRWYKLNQEALKRGVKIERIFILPRSEVVKGGVWDERVFDILQWQAKDNIEVRVLWIEDVTQGDLPPQRDVLKNLVIFDEEEVLETTRIETRLYRTPSEKLSEYLATFKEQRRFSRKFENILAEIGEEK